MFGQLCERPVAEPPGARLLWEGAVVVLRDGAVVVLCAGAVLAVLLVLAALAIAAPPPTSAPVTASVVSTDLRLRIVYHLLCLAFAHDPRRPSERRRSQVSVG
jgi:hypothetical protein